MKREENSNDKSYNQVISFHSLIKTLSKMSHFKITFDLSTDNNWQKSFELRFV